MAVTPKAKDTKIIEGLMTRAGQAVRRAVRDLAGRADGRAPKRVTYRTMEHAYTSGFKEYPCAFVLSTGRSGTQTLAALLALSPELAAVHEQVPRLVHSSFEAYLAGPRVVASEPWTRLVLAARDDLVWKAARNGKTYVETNNRLTYLAPALAECFPSSRFIHLYRHPYSVVRSGVARGYYRGHSWDFARIRPGPSEEVASSWSSMSQVRQVAWYWARVNRLALSFFEGLPDARKLSLSAEDLFMGSADTIQRLFAFVGARTPRQPELDRVLRAKLNAQPFESGTRIESGLSAEDQRDVWAEVSDVGDELGYDDGPRP